MKKNEFLRQQFEFDTISKFKKELETIHIRKYGTYRKGNVQKQEIFDLICCYVISLVLDDEKYILFFW